MTNKELLYALKNKFTWELPPLGFLKINFDGSVLDRGELEGTSFIIRNASDDFVAIDDAWLVGTIVPMMELCTAWKRISYMLRVLKATQIFIEGDSSINIR